MLYQDKLLGRASIGARVAAKFALLFGARRYQDFDLLTVSPHLRRDIGLRDGEIDFRPADEIWRK
jgi:hypothetical protein